jgi:hypothetical protein
MDYSNSCPCAPLHGVEEARRDMERERWGRIRRRRRQRGE